MGLMDFFKKGKETPAPKQQPSPQQSSPQSQPRPTGQTSQPAPSNNTQPQPTTQRDYVIQSGDSLSKIAKRFYGNANDWQKIYQANKDKIKDPNLIHPGQKIIVP